MYKVTSSIEFCYGHRLVGHQGKCRYLHGHNGRIEVDVESEETDQLGMVMDFSELRGVVKRWIDENIDHRMVLSREDPVATALREMKEPVYLMDANPTAENLSRHIFEQVRGLGLLVSEVRLWETPFSLASYSDP
mgnify:CR=1 FL=1